MNQPGQRHPKRIGQRLLRQAFLLGLLLTLAFTGLQAWLDYRARHADVQKTLEQVRDIQAKGIISNLWGFDRQGLQANVDGIVNFRYINYAAVRDATKVVAEAGARKGQGIIAREIPLSYQLDGRLIPIGSLYLQADTSRVASDVLGRVLVLLWFQAATIAIVSLFFLLVFKRTVTRHLYMAADYFQSFDVTSLHVPLRLSKVRHEDEIDAMADAFNRMRENLAAASREQALAEQKIKASEQRLKLATEAGNVGIWDWNIVEDDLSWDNSMYSLYGITAGDFSGAYEAWSRMVHPEDRQAAEGEIQAALRGEREYATEFRIIQLDGTVRVIQARSHTFRDEAGKALRMIGTNIDITERKQAEEELKQHRQHLESLVEARTRELGETMQSLEAARGAAEAASRAKSDFLANMSHEIRTPMNAVIGMTHLALQTNLTEQQRQYLQKAKSAADGLLGIINDILDFSKIEAGKLHMDTREFFLADVFEQTTQLVGARATDKRLEFMLDVAPDVPACLVGDPMRLGQVLTNLCANAVKFTEEGEVILITFRRLETREDRVTLEFCVRDTGVGMTEEQTKRLFQPFSQVDMSSSRKFGGTGLGLAISKQLVELMGGRIWVSSQPGKGSEFFFTATFGFGHLKPESQVQVPDPSGLNILIVDDSPNARDILEGLVRGLGYRAETAASAEEGLAALRRGSFDLVLLDWRMPGVDGFEAARRIRQARDLPFPPKVILVTAYNDESVQNRALLEGLDGYLSKPVTPSSLLDALMGTMEGQPASHAFRPASHRPQAPDQLSSLQGLRVLLVEDNEFNQQVAMELLGMQGVAVTLANQGQEALDLARTRPFDAVLMDLQMPVMDGYEATRLFRADPAFATLPILAMTAHAMVQERERCLSMGMDDYITKPIDPDELFATLAKWVRRGAGRVASSRRRRAAPKPDPMAARPAQPVPALPQPAQAASTLQGAQALLVEDDRFNQDVATGFLELLGLEASLARNGLEALEKVRGQRFDVVLMDLQMPVMDGYEATRRMRSDPVLKGLPILAMSAHGEDEERDRCLSLGMNGYITKPINIDELHAALAACLRSQAGG